MAALAKAMQQRGRQEGAKQAQRQQVLRVGKKLEAVRASASGRAGAAVSTALITKPVPAPPSGAPAGANGGTPYTDDRRLLRCHSCLLASGLQVMHPKTHCTLWNLLGRQTARASFRPWSDRANWSVEEEGQGKLVRVSR